MRLGRTVASAGRSTPSIIPTTIFAQTMAAPVCPAETSPWARPSRTQLAATRIDELRFLRIGVVAGSSIVTTSDASTISMSGPEYPASRTSTSSSAARPTSRQVMPNSRTAAIAPSTLTRGASSPPIASTAIRTPSLSLLKATRVREVYRGR